MICDCWKPFECFWMNLPMQRVVERQLIPASYKHTWKPATYSFWESTVHKCDARFVNDGIVIKN